MSVDELEREQHVIDRAHAALAAMRAKTSGLLSDLRAAGKPDPDLEFALSRRIALLADSDRPLCFGRIDEEDGPVWYLGRRHVEDGRGDPLVLEWRVDKATPFYRARPSESLGLVRRRQLMVEAGHLVSYADDLFGEGAALDGDTRIRGGDALLAELERRRTGEMADIVATIQAEQDEVIRAELPGVLAVQGGPGTGKTAIGLHRAAYLLYNHPELARSGVLVVGPNRIFLRYIAQVLPSLGEEAVVQVALADLVPGVKTTVRDGFETQRAKGDARMAQVLARAVAARRTRVVDDLAVHVGLRRVVVRAADIDKLVTSLAARGAPYRSGRAALKTNMVRLVDLAARLAGAGDGIDRGFLTRELARQPQFGAAIDLAWPAVSAKALLTELLASPVRITEAAEGILSDAEQVALLRGSGKGFSQADLPLLDELHDLLAGNTHTYGHIVVDEAQDLTPMQLRMLGRRCPGGSVTVLGDLAQATGPWSPSNWEEVVAHLPQPSGWRQSELTLGYRAPGQVLDFASRLLREAAPGVPATTAVRPGRTAPFVLEVAPSDLLPAAVAEASRLSADGRSVGLIVADEDAKEAERFVRDVRTGDGSAIGLAERDGLRMPITLVGALAAKGLEFDSVVIVEPARIAGSTTRGLRLLYVALTRPIQHLSIVHSAPIPALLREPA